jgi:hypothetical protein
MHDPQLNKEGISRTNDGVRAIKASMRAHDLDLEHTRHSDFVVNRLSFGAHIEEKEQKFVLLHRILQPPDNCQCDAKHKCKLTISMYKSVKSTLCMFVQIKQVGRTQSSALPLKAIRMEKTLRTLGEVSTEDHASTLMPQVKFGTNRLRLQWW